MSNAASAGARWCRSWPRNCSPKRCGKRPNHRCPRGARSDRPALRSTHPCPSAAPAAADSVRSKHVSGSPPVVWPTVCVFDGTGAVPLYLDLPGFVSIVSGDCDHGDILDHQDPDLSGCTSDCAVADFNGNGAVTVQDTFDFLAACFNAGNCGPH